MKPPSSSRRALLFACALLCLAPTPGDIGGCGQEPKLLGARAFFQKKRDLDCSACAACAIANARCQTVCEGAIPREFPRGCFPLVHDGEVCLRALGYSSCDEYERYLDDRAPEIPTECNFCSLEADAAAEGVQ